MWKWCSGRFALTWWACFTLFQRLAWKGRPVKTNEEVVYSSGWFKRRSPPKCEWKIRTVSSKSRYHGFFENQSDRHWKWHFRPEKDFKGKILAFTIKWVTLLIMVVTSFNCRMWNIVSNFKRKNNQDNGFNLGSHRRERNSVQTLM